MTVSIPETEAFIQFRLNEMSSRNEHHKFEEIATRIARRRISSNVLIATGPVSSGGDQQRDAESYTTRIPDELPHSAGFAASASTTPIVVACTVQKEKLKQKVLEDLAGICSEDASPVEHVSYFSVHSISEGHTHDLQKTARETYGVTLDVFCGADIATLLAEADLVWVARHYLDLPSAMEPPPDTDRAPQWYGDLLENLRLNRGPAALTPATQGEVTRGLRYAIWDGEANADLPEWLDFMGAFLTDSDDGEDTELVFRACYEMAVARFRGMGVATGVEDLVRRAIEYACASDQPNIVDDATTLTTYWGTMWSTGVGRADAAEIAEAVDLLRVHVKNMLDATDPTNYPVRATTLTAVLAFSYLMPDWRNAAHEIGEPEPADIAPMAGVPLHEFEPEVSHLADLVNIDSAMEYLDKLIDLLPKARVYSVSSLATLFNIFSPLTVDHPHYVKVRDGLDESTASVEGDNALAGRCRNRAVALMKANKPLEALGELHNAKFHWFNGEAIYGAMLMMRYIATVYEDLGLLYAAKMYACVTAAIAAIQSDAHDKEHLPKALLEAAGYAQHAGCWADAAGLAEIAMMARALYLSDPYDFEKYPELYDVLATEALEVSAVRRYWPELEPIISKAHSDTQVFGLVNEMLEEAGAEGRQMSEDNFQKQAAVDLAGPVFGDLGPTRVIDFSALGVRWIFDFNNDRTTVLRAEGLCAAFQVLLADIATRDPVLFKTTVHISVEVAADASHETDVFAVDHSSREPRVNVILGVRADTGQQPHSAVTASTCIQLLDVVNARPSTDLLGVMDPMFREGLLHKLWMGRPYEEAAGLLLDEHYERCAASSRPASSAQYEPTEATALAASTKPGLGYSRDEALRAIRERYEVAYATLRYTFPRLVAHERIRGTLVRLRAAGWLDWQILVILVNLAWNWRLEKAGIPLGVDDPSRALCLARQPEEPHSPPVPLEIFLDDATVDLHTAIQMATVANSWKLRDRAEHHNGEALRDLLTRRYRYADDDIPHRDILDSVDRNGNLIPFVAPAPGGNDDGGDAHDEISTGGQP